MPSILADAKADCKMEACNNSVFDFIKGYVY